MKHVGERQIPYDLAHMWNFMSKQAKEKTKGETNRETHLTTENKLMVPIGELRGRWGETGDGDEGRHF